MPGFLSALLSSKILLSVVFSYAFAGFIKIFFNYLGENKLDPKMFFSTGGMPSSHTATVTAMAVSVYLLEGVSNLFVVCFIMAIVVISDAIGVRRAAGKQAKVLNTLINELAYARGFRMKRLYELLGHTPKQAVGGIILGIIVANLVFIFL